jgi:hypothetical protein
MAAPKQGLALPVSVPDTAALGLTADGVARPGGSVVVVGFGVALPVDPLQATGDIATANATSKSPLFRPGFKGVAPPYLSS